MMAAMERNEDLLRMDPNAGLGQLADETGGFLISNTNDLRAGFSRIERDMRNYYLLTYVPSNDEFDGKFREIAMKVKRGGVNVHSRKGYFAIRESLWHAGGLYEAPALALLDSTPVPNAFPVLRRRAAVSRADRPHLLPLVVEVSHRRHYLRAVAEDKKSYRSDFTVLVRFNDGAKQVIDKMSQRYEVPGPIEKHGAGETGPGDLLSPARAAARHLHDGDGRLRRAGEEGQRPVHDRRAADVEPRRVAHEQPDAGEPGRESASRISARAAIRCLSATRCSIPNLGLPLKKGADKELAFFFTAYPGGGTATQLAGTLELLQDAKILARAPMTLPAADTEGRVQQVSRLPIDQLAPGRYQLRVLVQQGSVDRGAVDRVPDRVVGNVGQGFSPASRCR